jgi:hypothetical protein
VPNPRLLLRITPEKLDAYSKAAVDAGLALEDWARRALDDATGRSREPFARELECVLGDDDVAELNRQAALEGKSLLRFLAGIIQPSVSEFLLKREMHIPLGPLQVSNLAQLAAIKPKYLPPQTPPVVIPQAEVKLAIQKQTGQRNIQLDLQPPPGAMFGSAIPVEHHPELTKEEQRARAHKVARALDWPADRLETVLREIEEGPSLP